MLDKKTANHVILQNEPKCTMDLKSEEKLIFWYEV